MNHINTDNSDCHSFYAAVLAGGLSTRMGCDKRFLKIDGELLIDRALRISSEAIEESRDHVFICGDVPGYQCLTDSLPRSGPVAGLVSAVRRVTSLNDLKSTWLLTIPVDMPLLSSSTLKNLIHSLIHLNDPKINAISFNQYELPLLLQCNSETLCILEQVLNANDSSLRSIRSILKNINSIQINSDHLEAKVMMNTNRPSEWEVASKEAANEFTGG